MIGSERVLISLPFITANQLILFKTEVCLKKNIHSDYSLLIFFITCFLNLKDIFENNISCGE